MWYIIGAVAIAVVFWTFGFVVCAGLANGKCSDCRLKEIKDFEDGKSE